MVSTSATLTAVLLLGAAPLAVQAADPPLPVLNATADRRPRSHCSSATPTRRSRLCIQRGFWHERPCARRVPRRFPEPVVAPPCSARHPGLKYGAGNGRP